MKHVIEKIIELMPILTPNFILVKGEEVPIPIENFTDLQLTQLCDEFRENLIAKARVHRKK